MQVKLNIPPYDKKFCVKANKMFLKVFCKKKNVIYERKDLHFVNIIQELTIKKRY